MKKMELSTQKHGYKLIFCIGVFAYGKLKRSSTGNKRTKNKQRRCNNEYNN